MSWNTLFNRELWAWYNREGRRLEKAGWREWNK